MRGERCRDVQDKLGRGEYGLIIIEEYLSSRVRGLRPNLDTDRELQCFKSEFPFRICALTQIHFTGTMPHLLSNWIFLKNLWTSKSGFCARTLTLMVGLRGLQPVHVLGSVLILKFTLQV